MFSYQSQKPLKPPKPLKYMYFEDLWVKGREFPKIKLQIVCYRHFRKFTNCRHTMLCSWIFQNEDNKWFVTSFSQLFTHRSSKYMYLRAKYTKYKMATTKFSIWRHVICEICNKNWLKSHISGLHSGRYNLHPLIRGHHCQLDNQCRDPITNNKDFFANPWMLTVCILPLVVARSILNKTKKRSWSPINSMFSE